MVNVVDYDGEERIEFNERWSLQGKSQLKKAAEDPPTTGFEDSDGDKWTTLDEGYKFINSLTSKSDRVTSSVVGTSHQGRPLKLVKVGFPKPPCDADIASGRNILMMGTPHGNEPAGREAIFKLIRELAFTDEQDLLQGLKDATIMFIPTPNPDGRKANTRKNANGLDNNRDHLKLETPEIQAVASIIDKYQPDIIVDAHERPTDTEDPEIEMLWPRNLNVYQPLRDLNKEMVQYYLRPDIEKQDYTTGLYGTPPNSGSGSERILRNMSGLRHSLGLLTETAGRQEPKKRVTIQKHAMDSVLRFYRERFDDVSKVVDEAPIQKQEAGGNQDPFYLKGTREWDLDEYPRLKLDPAPEGYLITDSQAEKINQQVALFSLKTQKVGNTGVYVPMNQPMMTIIPLLMDNAAEYNEVDGIPLYNTNNPGTVANMKSLVPHFRKQGAFTGDQAEHEINTHLCAVNQYVQQGTTQKVIKHLKGFKALLDHQEKKKDLSERACHIFQTYTDYLLKKWQ